MLHIIPDPTEPTTLLESADNEQESESSQDATPAITVDGVLISFTVRGEKPMKVKQVSALADVVNLVRTDEGLRRQTERLRGIYHAAGRSKTKEVNDAKKQLPTIIPAVGAPVGTKVARMSADWATGLYGYDLDENNPDLTLVKDLTSALPSTVLVSMSSTGSGLWAIVRGPVATTSNEYKDYWGTIKGQFPENVVVASGTGGEASKNLNHLRYLAHDPDAYYNPAATPMVIDDPLAGLPLDPFGDTKDEDCEILEDLNTEPAAPNQPAKSSRRKGDKNQDPLDMLLKINAGSLAYPQWLGTITSAKAAGIPMGEVQAWTLLTRAPSTRQTDVGSRWDGLEEEERPKALRNLRKWSTRGYGNGKETQGGQKVGGGKKLEDWFQFGEWLGQQVRGQFRYDNLRGEWWEWNANRWMQLEDDLPVSLSIMIRRNRGRLDNWLAELSATFTKAGPDGEAVEIRKLRLTEQNYNAHRNLGIADGLKWGCKRPFPDYENDQEPRRMRAILVAVPSCVVNLDTGECRPHDPLTMDTRAITNGDYRPQDLAMLEGVLRDRLRPVFDDEMYEKFLAYIGMTVSGLGQSYRSIILCRGGEGDGKGGTARLIKMAFGSRGTVLTMSLLERSPHEIDATRYRIMRDQPLFLFVDDPGNVNINTLLGLSGDNPLPGARLPYMTMVYTDTLPSVIWWTSVDIPALKRGTGIDRRLGYLAFDKVIHEEAKDPNQYYRQDLLDALVTVGIDRAIAFRARKLDVPDTMLPAGMVDTMDPVLSAIDSLPDKWNAQLVSDAMKHVMDVTGASNLTATAFGNSVNSSKVWSKERATVGPNRNLQILSRKPDP